MLQEYYVFLFMAAVSYFWESTEKIKLNGLKDEPCHTIPF